MSTKKTLPPSYFETKYRADIDPWRFRTSSYEQAKYEATVAALTKRKYQNGLEVGCAIGILSASLAQRCDKLLALDASITAIAEASQQNLPNVRFETAFLPDDFPISAFDLIVLSEVLYYFSKDDLRRLAEKCLEALKGGGEVILCHWLGETDYPLTGHQASDLFAKAVAKRRPTHAVLHEDIYLLERLSFSSSVANEEE
jgi:2-polyprenyl-3-methyl-5-hydroxy-6-metoxy-1,4-benzoquinol methylase